MSLEGTPTTKKQNYRPSAPCSFVFPPDSSSSSRGVQAGNADSAQSRQQGGGGLYTAVTSHGAGRAIGQPCRASWEDGGAILCSPSPASHFTVLNPTDNPDDLLSIINLTYKNRESSIEWIRTAEII